MTRQSGQTLPETMLALAIFAGLGWTGLPALHGWYARAQLVGVAEVFKGEFRRARSLAIRRNAYTALRFEEREDGVYLRVALDRDYDGVLSRDLRSGVDLYTGEERRLTDLNEVRLGVLPGVPEPPPGSGILDPSDPIRFGKSNMVSFSPLGGATPGTLYFEGHGLMAAVRVNGGSGRVFHADLGGQPVAPALRRAGVSPETRMLAAIRTWALDRRPWVSRVLPAWAPAGAPVLLVGSGLGEGALEARYGRASTWGLALRDDLAVSVVPPGAGSPLVVFRRALASNPVSFRPADGDGPTRVVRVDPADGALGVLRDTPVVVRFSRPLELHSVEGARVGVTDSGPPLAGRLRLSPDGRVLIWLSGRPLAPDAGHSLRLEGLRDERGEAVEPWTSTFATGRLTRLDLG